MKSTTPVVRTTAFSTGTVRVHPEHVAATWKPMMLWMLTSRSWTDPLPINVFVIEHNDGLVLFDTGQDRASVSTDTYFPGGPIGAMYRRTARADIPVDQTLTAGLQRLGYDPADVKVVVLSHFHQDHIGGLAELPSARVIASSAEWATLDGRGALLSGIMRKHIDLPNLDWSIIDPEPLPDGNLAPFTTGHDIYADQSLVIVPTPGHTPGSLSLIVRRGPLPPLALVGDLTYGVHHLNCGHVPGSGERKVLEASTSKLKGLCQNLDGLVVLPTHDPTAQARLEASSR